MKLYRSFKRKQIFSFSLLILIIATFIYGSYYVNTKLSEKEEVHFFSETEDQLSSLTMSLESQFESSVQVAKSIARNTEILNYLETGESLDNVNHLLDITNEEFNSSVVYVMDVSGTAVLSSNRDTEGSFVGSDYSFRPYFQKAIEGDVGTYFAVGVTSGVRGYYVGVPVYSSDKAIIGVVVIKKNIGNFEDIFELYGDVMFVSPDGFVFLSTKKERDFTFIRNLSEEEKERIIQSKQFGDVSFEIKVNLDFKTDKIVAISGVDTYVKHREILDGWSVILLTDLTNLIIYQNLVLLIIVGINILCFVFLIMYYLTSRSNEKILQAKDRFEQVTEVSKDWVWEVDKDGIFTYSNSSVTDIMGYSLKEIVGKHYCNFLLEECEVPNSSCSELGKKDEVYVVTKKITHKDGRQILVKLNSVSIVDNEGDVIGVRGVVKDLTEIVKWNKVRTAYETEKKERKHIELLSRQKSEFISVASHQLRTPLTAIKIFTEMLTDSQKNMNKAQKKSLLNIKHSADRMMKVIGVLLNIVQIEQGKLKVCPVKTDINKLIKGVITELAPIAEEDSIKISFKPQPKMLKILVDQNLLAQCVHNLISNSIRYSPKKTGKITVELNIKDKKYYFIKVSDNGIGILKDEQSHVYEKFFRSKSAMKKTPSGFGLGMYFVKTIVDQVGGTISVESSEGKGTSFEITLPLSGMKADKSCVKLK